MTNPNDNDLLTIQEVAEILRVRPRTVREYVRNRILQACALPHAHNHKRYRIKRKRVNQLLNNETQLAS